MKTRISALAVGLCIFFFVAGQIHGTPSCQAAEKEMNLQFFTPLPVTHDVSQIVTKSFIEPVAKATGGRIKFTLRPAGEMPYKGTEALDVLRNKLVDMSYIIGPYVGGEEPLFDVPNYAYLVNSEAEVPKMVEIARPILGEALSRKWNGVLLFENVWPGQQIWSGTKILKKVEEIKGMKLRSHGVVTSDLTVLLGAVPVSMTISDVYQSMGRGVIDGMWIAVTSAVPSKLHEVTKSILLMDAQFAYDAFALRKDIWDTLSDGDRKILKDAGDKTTLALREFMFGKGAEPLWNVVKEKGIVITTVSAAEKDVVREKAKPYWDKWAKAGGAESEAMLTALKNALK